MNKREDARLERATVGTASHATLPDWIAACLFDLDGVLTDSALIHQRAWELAFNEYFADVARHVSAPIPRFAAPDYVTLVDGKPRLEAVQAVLSDRDLDRSRAAADMHATVAQIAERKQHLYLQELQRHGIFALPGAFAYLQSVRAASRPTAVVSSSRNARYVLEMTGLAPLIDVRIDGEYMHQHGVPGKPAPDPFLRAAKLLGHVPHACAVYEDALVGVAAARRGRFGLVVGIAPADRADALEGAGADLVVPSLQHLLHSAAPS